LIGQPIELDHQKLVARPNEVHDGGQLVASGTALAAHLFLADNLAPDCLEPCFLSGSILLKRADPRIANSGQIPTPMYRLIPSSLNGRLETENQYY
jgi:hypothetical protein